MRLTDVGIATCKKVWVCPLRIEGSSEQCKNNWISQTDVFIYLFSDTRALKETAPPPSSTSSRLCTSATRTVRSWASTPCSLKPKSQRTLRNPNPNLRPRPRRNRLGPQWRGSRNQRGTLWSKSIGYWLVSWGEAGFKEAMEMTGHTRDYFISCWTFEIYMKYIFLFQWRVCML